MPRPLAIDNETDLIRAASALGALRVPDVSPEERALIAEIPRSTGEGIKGLRRAMQWPGDPLGEAFTRLRAPAERRLRGATYTPPAIVEAMVGWAAAFRQRRDGAPPARIVDPGAGSARFLLAAAAVFPDAELIGVEIDPLAALIARANLAVAGHAERSRIVLGDYRELNIPAIAGRTLYIGNPPYVRHHELQPQWKQWLTTESRRLGYDSSQLAGLHVHFFLATALHARRGDFGAFITAAEWLDVNYGQLVRKLFLNELGGQGLTLIEPTARPFVDAASTAVIGTFEIGSKPRGIRVRRLHAIAETEPLGTGRLLHRTRFDDQSRWSHLTRRTRPTPAGFIELGELCRVHRGQVTGLNRIWISGPHAGELPPSVLFRSVTRARELFRAGGVLNEDTALRDVVDLPVDLSGFPTRERRAIDRFLKFAEAAGAAHGYVAENRKAWWSVGLKSPAPVLATYMARRPPAFVRNLTGARHINIAHGLYPRQTMSPQLLDRLAAWLSKAVDVSSGRTYSGGLTKFEPREMERLLVPSPDLLAQMEG